MTGFSGRGRIPDHRGRRPYRGDAAAAGLLVPVGGPQDTEVVEASAGDLKPDRLPFRPSTRS